MNTEEPKPIKKGEVIAVMGGGNVRLEKNEVGVFVIFLYLINGKKQAFYIAIEELNKYLTNFNALCKAKKLQYRYGNKTKTN